MQAEAVRDRRGQQHFEVAGHLLVDRIANGQALARGLPQGARHCGRAGDGGRAGGVDGGAGGGGARGRGCGARGGRAGGGGGGRAFFFGAFFFWLGRAVDRDRFGEAGLVATRVDDCQRDFIFATVLVGVEYAGGAGGQPRGAGRGFGGVLRGSARSVTGDFRRAVAEVPFIGGISFFRGRPGVGGALVEGKVGLHAVEADDFTGIDRIGGRSEEHTSELQS